MAKQDEGLLQAALVGYQAQLVTINERIAELERRLGRRRASAGVPVATKKHRISPEGRARIAAAQRRRWAKRLTAQERG